MTAERCKRLPKGKDRQGDLHERSGPDDRIFGWRNNMFSNGRKGNQVMMKILDGDVVREDRRRRNRRLAEGWRSIGC